MTFPPGLQTRHASLGDAGAVLELAHACEQMDLGEALYELSDIQATWNMPSVDLQHDSLLVFDGVLLVASGLVANERADVYIHPEARGCGIGTAMIQWAEDRARIQATQAGRPARVGQTVPSRVTDAISLFERRGYAPLWDSWVLRLAEDASLDQTVPDGIEIRPFRPSEGHDIYALIDSAFNEWPGRESRPFSEWQAHVLHRTDFDPTLLLVAVEDGKIVGAVVGIHYEGEGWVDQMAVDANHRGRGIARALLATLFAVFRSRGEHRLGLNTDSRTGALDLYLKLGMQVELTFTRWSAELSE